MLWVIIFYFATTYILLMLLWDDKYNYVFFCFQGFKNGRESIEVTYKWGPLGSCTAQQCHLQCFFQGGTWGAASLATCLDRTTGTRVPLFGGTLTAHTRPANLRNLPPSRMYVLPSWGGGFILLTSPEYGDGYVGGISRYSRATELMRRPFTLQIATCKLLLFSFYFFTFTFVTSPCLVIIVHRVWTINA
jgi:hypothetical protein